MQKQAEEDHTHYTDFNITAEIRGSRVSTLLINSLIDFLNKLPVPPNGLPIRMC